MPLYIGHRYLDEFFEFVVLEFDDARCWLRHVRPRISLALVLHRRAASTTPQTGIDLKTLLDGFADDVIRAMSNFRALSG
ncbi:hypothetical protein [Mesorhizobium sp. M0977]|uniref:hypothetical protein n=1 Tax=unclassified Mesorhizobium TaxID=325217 RepID=UPI003334C1E6